jgi:hypothetical protein
MNKKGNLLGEETLRVVLSVVAILLLVLLLFNLYVTFSNKPKLEKAKSSLERIEGKINEAFLKGASEELLLEPNGWILLNYKNGEPESCSDKKCICICEKEGLFGDQIKNCKKNGICKITDKNLIFKEIEIDGITGINFEKKEESILISIK